MAKTEKKTEKPASEGEPPKNKWASMLDDLKKSGSGGPFFFIKKGRTQIRLVPDDDGDFFIETVDERFPGKPKRKFLLSGIVLKVDGELNERWQNKVVPIVVAKSVMENILMLLAEDNDLLDDETGLSIVIRRDGDGLNSTYAAMPSKPYPLHEGIQPMEKTLGEYDLDFRNRNIGTTETGKDDDEGMGGGDW